MAARRTLRAMLLASLAALVLSRQVFTGADLIRVKVVQAPQQAVEGLVRVTTAGFPQVEGLRPPFALIARVNHLPPGTNHIAISTDGIGTCERQVNGGDSHRVDCAVATQWKRGIEHEVTVQGPPGNWTLDYLELATHHGNTSGAHYLIIFPGTSDRYERPARAWIAALWLLLTAILFLPAPKPLSGWIRILYRVVAGAVILVMTASLLSQWLSDYRVVIAARSFTLWLALLLVPRLSVPVNSLVQAEKRSRSRWMPVAHRLVVAPRLARLLAVVTVVTIMAVGFLRGSFIVGGSDSYGYVSEAHLMAAGKLRVEQPFVREMKWPLADEAFAPLGYRPTLGGTVLLPTYSPGLPMVMAAFEWVGGRDAVFYVVPLLGALAVWATYLMGSPLGGPWVGLAAALLLATSPTFLIQLLAAPMSDVPAAAWWALSLACAISERRATVLLSGLAGGAAILTRPNLVPLAAIPGVLLLWRVVRDRTLFGPAAQRLMLFAVGILSGCIVTAIINTQLWGSPLNSGYGSFDAQFAWANLRPNLERYPKWTFETQTPAVLIALLAVFVVKRSPEDDDGIFGRRAIAITWSAFVAAVYLSYLFYSPFDAWFYLRFMLPAYPPLFVLVVAALAALLTRMKYGVLATVMVVGILVWHGWSYTSAKGILNPPNERHANVAVGDYIKKNLPERALLVSMQQSGSVRYYSRRLTVRWDWIPPEMLDRVLDDVRRLGYRPYFVLENWEEPQFQERFRQYSALSALDWLELARHPMGVKIYDPADKLAPLPTRRTTSDLIK